MANEIIIPAMFIALVAGIVSCLRTSNMYRMFKIPVITSMIVLILCVLIFVKNHASIPFLLYDNNVLVDQLSLYHILLVNVIFLISSIYATGYFKLKIREGSLRVSYAKRYCMLWQAFHVMLLIVLLSNNIGVMWVALEATTLVSAFLIVSDSDKLSVEAMWKYLLICSVGIVFAFLGTILTVAAARELQSQNSLFLFSQLVEHADLIDPKLMLFAFIFIVVGFGTKAGLSPMHTWLPDAHSQAPTPVSAVFSGVMLNCALYCIMRYLPITEAALGWDGQAHSILLLFGFMSLVFSAVFIPIQHDMKRFLAYCSVEHIGIIAIGLGLGGFGTFAALLHTTNHSLSKVLAFFSAGHIGEHFRTRDMRRISGVVGSMPTWGTAFFVSILVLIGVAPFSIFYSEFLILKEAFFQGRFIVVTLFIFCALVVFVSALKYTMDVSFGKNQMENNSSPQKAGFVNGTIVLVFIVALLILGVWIPSPFGDFLKNAALIVENGIKL